MTILIALLFFLYIFFLGLLILGWRKTLSHQTKAILTQEPLLSIVIAARNEEAQIGELLQNILEQSYKNFEVIVVDDHSTDNTVNVVRRYLHHGFRLISNHGEGKKLALTTGIKISNGEVIVTTDADCRVGKYWLESIVKGFQHESTKMAFGGVKIRAHNFFSTLQAHEFLSLIGTAVGTLSWGFPSMCNAANLAFRKIVFDETGGYENNLHIPSGDDEFLMLAIFKAYPNGVHFLSAQNAVVETAPAQSLNDFVHQRVRWAGKFRHNLSLSNIALATFIFCFHASVLTLIIGIALGSISPLVGSILLSLKLALEWIFLSRVALFLRVPWQTTAFIVLQLLYPFYVLTIGILSTFRPYRWKDRSLKSTTFNSSQNKSLGYNDL